MRTRRNVCVHKLKWAKIKALKESLTDGVELVRVGSAVDDLDFFDGAVGARDKIDQGASALSRKGYCFEFEALQGSLVVITFEPIG